MIKKILSFYPCSMYLLVSIISFLCSIGEAIDGNIGVAAFYFILYILNVSFISYTLMYPEKVKLKIKDIISKETNGS